MSQSLRVESQITIIPIIRDTPGEVLCKIRANRKTTCIQARVHAGIPFYSNPSGEAPCIPRLEESSLRQGS